MTETCSQIGSDYYYEGHDGYIPIMNIHEIFEVDKHIFIKSESMFTSKIIFHESRFEIVKANLRLELPDRLSIKQSEGKTLIKPLGRHDDFIKISGRLISLIDIRNGISGFISRNNLQRGLKVSSMKDVRLGHKVLIEVLIEHQHLFPDIINELTKTTSLSETYFDVRISSHLEMTELGKFKK